jgi:hypothetical protein
MKKTVKHTIKHFMTVFLTGLVILLFNSCESFNEEDIILPDSAVNEELIPWNDLLNLLDFESEIAFVQNGESIQDAIDNAQPGDVIYIEPGNYQGKITNNKPNIKLIAISFSPDDLIINNNKENNIDILKLYDQNSIDNFQNKSKNRIKKRFISNFSRTELGNNIVHYGFDVRMGEGEFDNPRVHRVVKERFFLRPNRTKGHVFMVHGANQDFDDIFLTAGAETIDAKTSSPFYLASNDIDVWGIDMGWTKVPSEGVTDFSFMKDWDVEKDVSHTMKTMLIARVARLFTRQGASALNLLGFSYGVDIVYGAAGRETQQPNWMKRNIKGIIPVDSEFKSETSSCNSVDYFKNYLSIGQYYNPWLDDFPVWGDLALNSPDEPSGVGAFTNSQFLEYIGTQGFFAGDENNKFIYTEPLRFFRLSMNLALRMPTKIFLDMSSVNCETEDVNYDDYLAEISVPVLYISASNDKGSYTNSLVASQDITSQIIEGYGHADLWMSRTADQDVWSDLRSWLVDHK